MFMILKLNVKNSMGGFVEIALAVLALYNLFMGLAHLNAELMRRETLSEEGAELEGRLLLRVEGEREGGIPHADGFSCEFFCQMSIS